MASKKNPLDNTITDEIKEEEQEGSDDSDGEDGKKPPSPGAESTGAGSNWNRNVDEGDDVQEGQVLLRIDQTQFQAAVAQASIGPWWAAKAGSRSLSWWSR